ncbi:MAG: O-antigen ligase family protein [Candidatus Doudnabacteria bacterium]|nr:O-antigen ligase family protein [Candidatus Doudnabacteria bacterium]
MKQLSRLKEMKFSQIFFWLFLLSIPWNKRIIYNPEHAYIDGYFSYYLAFFLYISDILLGITLIAYIVEQRAMWRWPKLSKNHILWPILGLFCVILVGMFHVQHDLTWSSYSVLKSLELGLLVWFVARGTPNSLKQSALILYLSGIFQAIVAIWQFHVQHGLGLSWIGEYIAPLGTGGLATIENAGGKLVRAYGTFPHPNILGFFLCLALILGYYLIVSRETSQKLRNFIIFGDYLLIVGICLTFSRVSWVIAAFATLSFLLYLRRHEKWLKLAILLPAIVSCGTILILWHGLLFNRIANIETSNSYNQRVELNTAGLDITKKYPVFGNGLGNYIPVMKHMFHMEPWEYQPPHNVFIYIAASLGVVGLGFLLWILGIIFWSGWNSPASDWKFTLLVLGCSLLFVSMFDHFPVTIQQGQLIFGLILGLILAYAQKT